MSNYNDDEVDDIEDKVENGADGMDSDDHGNDDRDSDSDNEGNNTSDNTDTSAADVRLGGDMQGIPWHDLSFTRENYRQTRLRQYKNYENVPGSGELAEKDCKSTHNGGSYYEFTHNTRSVKSTILHFQLRNLIWATSKHDVYLMSHYSVLHWSALTGFAYEIMDLKGRVAPRAKHAGSLAEGFYQTQVSTLAVKEKWLVAGGFQGELICKNLDDEGISFCCRVTHEDNAITNAVEIYDHPSGGIHFLSSNNDSGVRDYDMEKFQLCKHFRFLWPVNCTSLSPDQKLLAVVGDDPVGLLVDARTGKILHELEGHKDYSFASAWSPDGNTIATGNQDKTCRIWDVRNLTKAVHVLRGNIGAIRSLRFTSDGQFMAMAEPADFVHIYDVGSGYSQKQELDFFGEISGMSFSPDDEVLFVGVWDRTYGSLLQFRRRHSYSYLDSLL